VLKIAKNVMEEKKINVKIVLIVMFFNWLKDIVFIKNVTIVAKIVKEKLNVGIDAYLVLEIENLKK